MPGVYAVIECNHIVAQLMLVNISGSLGSELYFDIFICTQSFDFVSVS